MQMINSGKGIGFTGAGTPSFHKQQSAMGAKKSILRDLQNETINNREETSRLSEVTNGCKISGVKRLAPEYPSNSNNVLTKQFTYSRKKLETETTKPVIPQLGCFNQKQQNQIALLPKPANGLFSVDQDSVRVSTEIPPSPPPADHQLSKEGPDSLLNYLKKYDEFDKRDYTKMLVNMAPAELSRHAVELEKRAIQLTIDEGKEIQRMKQLNILGVGEFKLIKK